LLVTDDEIDEAVGVLASLLTSVSPTVDAP
jgi:hypothetical protein